MKAMRQGLRPDGANLFPAFPYPSFTKITDDDLRDLWAYLRALPPNSRPSRPHDLRFPFSWRFAVTFWNWLYFKPGPVAALPGASPAVNRGAYLVQALGHCGECHSPRNFLGAPVAERFLAGGEGPDGKRVPGIDAAALELWSDEELRNFFVTGIDRDDDRVAESMYEVVRNTTSKLTAEDASAMIAYLRSLPGKGR